MTSSRIYGSLYGCLAPNFQGHVVRSYVYGFILVVLWGLFTHCPMCNSCDRYRPEIGGARYELIFVFVKGGVSRKGVTERRRFRLICSQAVEALRSCPARL